MRRICIVVFLCVRISGAQVETDSSCDANRLNVAVQRARSAQLKHDYTTAIQQFRQALAACTQNRTIQLELANSLFMGQRLQESKDTVQILLEADPANSAALEIKGNIEYLQGDTRTAVNTFIDLLECHPESLEAPYMLGRIYYEEGLLDQAIGQFRRLLKLDPQSFKAYDNLALCYEAKGDDVQATSFFLDAIKLSEEHKSGYDVAYADLAELLLRSGDPERAFGAASKAADRNPYAARNFYFGGKALDQLGKTELSLNWLLRSAALDPNYPEPQYLLARIYRRLGQQKDADAAQQKFLKIKTKSHHQLPQ